MSENEIKEIKTSPALLKAIDTYHKKLDDIKFRVPKGKRDIISEYAKQQGFKGLQPYIKHLIEQDSGIDLEKDD